MKYAVGTIVDVIDTDYRGEIVMVESLLGGYVYLLRWLGSDGPKEPRGWWPHNRLRPLTPLEALAATGDA